jgi:hypothetical protein
MLYLVIAAASISAQGFSPHIEAAATRLAKAHIFAIGGVGFAGTTSDEEKDFRLIVADDHAPDVFANLYERGNNQAKAYALLGLYLVNTDRFRKIYDSLPVSNEELLQMKGCIISKERLSVIAKGIDSGQIRPQPSRK